MKSYYLLKVHFSLLVCYCECLGLFAGESRHRDMVLSDRSASIAGETYSDVFDDEAVSEDDSDEVVVEVKPVTQARLPPSAQLGYTWT